MGRSLTKTLIDIEENQLRIYELVSESFEDIDEKLTTIIKGISDIKKKLNIE